MKFQTKITNFTAGLPIRGALLFSASTFISPRTPPCPMLIDPRAVEKKYIRMYIYVRAKVLKHSARVYHDHYTKGIALILLFIFFFFSFCIIINPRLEFHEVFFDSDGNVKRRIMCFFLSIFARQTN